VDDADRAMVSLNGKGRREGRKRVPPAPVVTRRDATEPAFILLGNLEELRPEPASDGYVVVAKGDGFEAVLKPLKRVVGMGTAVHKVSNAEEPIAGGVEDDLAESTLEGSKAPVNIADNDVASARRTIARDNRNNRGVRVGTLVQRHRGLRTVDLWTIPACSARRKDSPCPGSRIELRIIFAASGKMARVQEVEGVPSHGGRSMPRPRLETVQPIIDQHREPIVAAVLGAWDDWMKSPFPGIWRRRRSRANFVWEQIIDRAHRALESSPDVYIVDAHETYQFLVDDQVLFRFKKGDDAGLSVNVPTQLALAFHNHEQNLFGLPDVHRVEVVYQLSWLETEIRDVRLVGRDEGAVVWSYSLLDTAETVAALPIPERSNDVPSLPARRLIRPRGATEPRNREKQD